ncbi:MAG: hypothetical protein ACP5P1_12505 [Acidimicrobiales bacterium]
MAAVIDTAGDCRQCGDSGLEALRADLAGHVAVFMDGAAERNRRRSQGATVAADGSTRRGPAPPSRPTLLALSPGIGKTTALAAAVSGSATPCLVLTPLSETATAWRGRLQARGGTVALHQPRRAPTDEERRQADGLSAPAGVCWRMQDVAAAGVANHVPSASVCRVCPHGLRSQWLAVEHASSAAVALFERIEAAMKAHPHMPDPLGPNVAACGYLPAVKLAAQADVLVATAAAFTPTMLTVAGRRTLGVPVEAQDRALIVDEAPPLTRRLSIDSQVAGQWLTALTMAQLAVKREQEHDDRDDRDDRGDLAVVALALQDVRPHLERLHKMLADGNVDRGDMEGIAAALHAAAKRAPTGTSISAGRWETIKVRWTTQPGSDAVSAVVAVLRAAVDVGWAAQHGALRLVPARITADGTGEPARIELAAPTQIGEALIAVSVPTVIADATASRTLRAVVEAQGGTIHDIHPPVPVTVRRDSSRGWGRGRSGAGATRRAQREAWELVVRARKMHKPGRARPVILTHKPWAELIASRGWWPKHDVGWWGADERAHDRWAGRDMLIAGVPTLSPEAAEDLYRADRALALAAGAPEADWPEWTPQRVERAGRMASTCEAIQAWDDDRVAGHLAQAVGRVRPLDHPGSEILLLGPPVNLEQHGVTVEELDSEPDSGAGQRRHVARLGRLLRLAEAAANLESQHKKVTRAALRSQGAGGRSDLYSKLRAELARAGSARCLAGRLRAELAAETAASGWKLATARSRPDAAGNTRLLTRAVIDEEWLTANTRRVVNRIKRRCESPTAPARAALPARATAQGP